jgi:hypothetical protein
MYAKCLGGKKRVLRSEEVFFDDNEKVRLLGEDACVRAPGSLFESQAA